MVANRTAERARPLAERFNAGVIALNDLPEHLALYDIIITSTASPLPILGKGLVERALKQRRQKPFFMVDLAVPRDVEEEVGELDDVFLYTVDDLGHVVREGQDQRVAQVAQAEAIIETSVQDFLNWMDTREMVPMIRGLRDHAERHRRHEIERARKLLEKGESPEVNKGCVKCHALKGEGGKTGPDLGKVDLGDTQLDLVAKLLEPYPLDGSGH